MLGYVAKLIRRMRRSKSYRAVYSSEEEIMPVSIRTYKQPTKKSRSSMSSFTRLRDRSARRRPAQRNTRHGAGVAPLAGLLALV